MMTVNDPALTYSLYDRSADEYKDLSEDEAAAITREADLHTGPWGYMGGEIDQVLYAEDEDGDPETLAVRYQGHWLFVPPGQEPHVSHELTTNGYEG